MAIYRQLSEAQHRGSRELPYCGRTNPHEPKVDIKNRSNANITDHTVALFDLLHDSHKIWMFRSVLLPPATTGMM